MEINKFSFKISTTILSIFFVLVGVIATATIFLQFYFAKQLANKATYSTVQYVSQKTLTELNSINEFTNEYISLLSLSSFIEDTPVPNEHHGMLKKFVSIMSSKSYIYAMYTGHENGNFYEVINLDIDPKLRKKYKSSQKERWLVVKIFLTNNKRIRVQEYLDTNLNIIRKTTESTLYNPTQRPWYKQAMTSSEMIKTDPYMFSNLESLGVTYSKKVQNSNTVMSIDISLSSLTKFLQTQEIFKGSKLYIFNQKNQQVVASNVDFSNEDKTLHAQLNNFITNDTESLKEQSKDYFVSSVNLQSKYTKNEYLILILPQDEILKPYNEKILMSIYANIILMLITLPIIWYVSKIIINPIKALEHENVKIKNRKFDHVNPINSRIKEIDDLSVSMVSMSQSIKEYEEAQIKLMDSIIELIASAIDAKSEYTAGHGQRVPEITMMIAREASKSKEGIFKDFTFTDEEEERELKIAALLHDCGKITTPEYVVDKATKLETIYNRIHEIRTRFEVVHRDLEILYYKKLQNSADKDGLESWLKKEQQSLQEDFAFIATCNIGGEFMSDEYIERIKKIANITWIKNFDDTIGLSQNEKDRLSSLDDTKIQNLLCDKHSHIIKRTRYFQDEYEADGFKGEVPEHLYNLGEVYNLTVRKGTLTNEERFKINEHIIMSIKMLSQLPFPEQLKNVPEFAGAHHETLIGTGYPRQLTKDQMSLPARIMAVADIYEALTASDRPYKEPKKLSESIKILSFMVKDQHIDKDIFELFLTSGVYKEYGEKFLLPEQIDEVDISQYITK
ncbi:MAG: HD domain-containing phosphohydrolase [Arcobacteraceae bacterium]